MKTIIKPIFLLAFGLISIQAIGQGNVKESEAYKQQKQIYQTATKYNDQNVAKNALYKLIVIDPSDASLLDSLAYFYFDAQQFPSAILVSKDILARNPNHLAALEISAIAFERLGIKDQALSNYETLYLKSNNVGTLYKIAYLQYELKRYSESATSADILLKAEVEEDMNIIYNTAAETQQEIPIKASIYNLKGLIELENGNKTEAKTQFENALKLAPEFELAQENIKKLQS